MKNNEWEKIKRRIGGPEFAKTVRWALTRL